MTAVLPATSSLTDSLHALALALRSRHCLLGSAESCTGGLIAAACTELPGSSEWFDRGFVTYSNAAKTELLGVPAGLITEHGAVSQAVAHAMAEGVLLRTPGVHCAISTTGIAGPGGGSAAKPVGTVWFGWSCRRSISGAGLPGFHTHTECRHFQGERSSVREQALHHALQWSLQLLAQHVPSPQASRRA